MAIEKSKSIGGLYEKVSQKGLDYLNGFITVEGKKMKIVAFRNNMKATDTTPDYSIFLSEPMGAGAAEAPAVKVSDSGSDSDPFFNND